MERLAVTVRDYDWGSTTAIPDFLGEPATGVPQAELWIGAHPAASARLAERPGTPTLSDAIAQDPEGLLGSRVVEEFGARLPFLMKIIAPARPLSIQVHPNLATARAECQGDSGVFGDPFHKPEMLVALAPFDVLCGFRSAGEIARIFEGLGVPRLAGLAEMLDGGANGPTGTDALLTQELESARIRAVFEQLVVLDPISSRALVDETVAAAHVVVDRTVKALDQELTTSSRSLLEGAHTVLNIAEAFPHDIGVVLSLMMRPTRLEAGEAIFVDAGVIHCYLKGFGLEVMAASDNVARAALTTKTIDLPQLLAITDFAPTPTPRVEVADGGEGVRIYSPPVKEFELHIATTSLSGPVGVEAAGPQIVLALDGAVSLTDASGTCELTRGHAAFTGPDDGPLRLEPTDGATELSTLAIATIP